MLATVPIRRDDKTGIYTTPDGPLIGVTTMLHAVLGAADELVDWSVRKERERCATLAGALLSDPSLRRANVHCLPSITAQALQGPMAYKTARDVAADRGTAVDAWITAHCQSGRTTTLTEADSAIRIPIEAWLRWADATDFQPVTTQLGLWSPAWGVAGTADCIGYISGRLTLIDWKATSALRFAHRVQVTLYSALAHEQGYLDIPAVALVRAPWRAGYDVEVWTCDGPALAALCETARAVVRVWTAMQEG